MKLNYLQIFYGDFITFDYFTENDVKIFQLNTEMDDDTFLSILKKSNEIKPVPDVYDSINSIPQSNATLENVIDNIAGGMYMYIFNILFNLFYSHLL